jgi:hypothetical protein
MIVARVCTISLDLKELLGPSLPLYSSDGLNQTCAYRQRGKIPSVIRCQTTFARMAIRLDAARLSFSRMSLMLDAARFSIRFEDI